MDGRSRSFVATIFRPNGALVDLIEERSPRLAASTATVKRLDVLLKRSPKRRNQMWCLYRLDDFDQGRRSERSSMSSMMHRFGVFLTSQSLAPRRPQCY